MSKKYTDRQTEKITCTNERIRVLRPKSRILKVPFPFPFSVSVVRGIAPYLRTGIRKLYDFEI